MGIPFWGRCTTHFRAYFSGWIGMFTGGAIWLLTHGHISAEVISFIASIGMQSASSTSPGHGAVSLRLSDAPFVRATLRDFLG